MSDSSKPATVMTLQGGTSTTNVQVQPACDTKTTVTTSVDGALKPYPTGKATVTVEKCKKDCGNPACKTSGTYTA